MGMNGFGIIGALRLVVERCGCGSGHVQYDLVSHAAAKVYRLLLDHTIAPLGGDDGACAAFGPKAELLLATGSHRSRGQASGRCANTDVDAGLR
jgi:hypothetical protein